MPSLRRSSSEAMLSVLKKTPPQKINPLRMTPAEASTLTYLLKERYASVNYLPIDNAQVAVPAVYGRQIIERLYSVPLENGQSTFVSFTHDIVRRKSKSGCEKFELIKGTISDYQEGNSDQFVLKVYKSHAVMVIALSGEQRIKLKTRAVKIVMMNDGDDKNLEEMVLREAELIQETELRGKMPVMHEEDGHETCIMVMRHLEGVDLYELIDRQYRTKQFASTREILQISLNLIQKVELLHLKGIAHCDLKPDNTIVLRDGSVVLLDYGLSRRLGVGESLCFAGTLGYMPPEVLRIATELAEPGVLKANADYFALGMSLSDLDGVPFMYPGEREIARSEFWHRRQAELAARNAWENVLKANIFERMHDLTPEMKASLGAAIRQLTDAEPNRRGDLSIPKAIHEKCLFELRLQHYPVSQHADMKKFFEEIQWLRDAINRTLLGLFALTDLAQVQSRFLNLRLTLNSFGANPDNDLNENQVTEFFIMMGLQSDHPVMRRYLREVMGMNDIGFDCRQDIADFFIQLLDFYEIQIKFMNAIYAEMAPNSALRLSFEAWLMAFKFQDPTVIDLVTATVKLKKKAEQCFEALVTPPQAVSKVSFFTPKQVEKPHPAGVIFAKMVIK